MKPRKGQRFGFYWVRFEGRPTIGEYVKHEPWCAPKVGGDHWHLPGVAYCVKGSEICERLSDKLECPK